MFIEDRGEIELYISYCRTYVCIACSYKESLGGEGVCVCDCVVGVSMRERECVGVCVGLWVGVCAAHTVKACTH